MSWSRRRQRQDDPGENLCREQPRAVGDEREADQGGALRPLGGDQQDAHHRQEDPGGLQAVGEDVAEGPVFFVREESSHEDRDDGQRSHRDQQPEATAGVDHLAQLDLGQPGQARTGVAARRRRHRDRVGAHFWPPTF
jgi:hypothetical protein